MRKLFSKNKKESRPSYLDINNFDYGCAFHHQVPHKDVKDMRGKQLCRIEMKSKKVAIYEVERMDLKQSSDHTGQYRWNFVFLGYLQVPTED